MIHTQEHQIFDRVAAGATMADVAGMVANYIKGVKLREATNEGDDSSVNPESIPDTSAEEVAEWLSENYRELRRVSYPHWKDQLEMQYDDVELWRQAISAVKSMWPKTADPGDVDLGAD